MSKSKIIKSIFTEYGVDWAINRALYSAKLKMLCKFPQTEKLFEKKVYVKRTDIFTINISEISIFLSKLPKKETESIVELADDAIKGIINGFSSIRLDFGYPLNWQLNPLSGMSCSSSEKWYQIKDFDKERGDIKLVWEASRFTHFHCFTRAYMITKDKKYYTAFSDQLDDWLKKNPYSYGSNYKCGQECSLRMINALISYRVFDLFGLTTERDQKNILDLVDRCYRKILSNFFYAYKCIKNNHTLSELCGTIIGAWCCEDEKTLRKAYWLLDKEICNQFTIDGGYRQFSFNYQRFAMQICECIISLTFTTGIKLNRTSIERIKSSALLMYQCQSETGDLPNYGANDGALIFPVTCCGYRDFRPVINTVYALTSGKRLYPDGLYDEEMLWFGNSSYISNSIDRCSSNFPEAGLYTLRSTDSYAMICLNSYNSRPTHMDQLHFDLWYKSKNIFCDCGTYSYASKLGEKLVLTESHNTVKIDDTGQMNKLGNFMIYNWSRASDIVSTAEIFEGVMISKNGYRHKRHVEIIENGYCISDEVNTENSFEILFHTLFDVAVNGNTVIIYNSETIVCTIQCNYCNIYTTDEFCSLFYLVDEKITAIHLSFSNDANNRRIITNIKLGDMQK